MGFREALINRRSIYAIGKDRVLGKEKVEGIVKDGILHIPSPFNVQSNRAVVLFGEKSDEFWDKLIEIMKGMLSPDRFPATEEKLLGFKAGYGTVLFFIDDAAINELKDKFPLYAHNFTPWSEHSQGMLQYYIWAGLEAEGLGANLQHYNELVEEFVKEKYPIKEGWRLTAQMPFGKALEKAGEKEFLPIEETFVSLGE
ncbi:MAG: nitroreductase family protein [Tissierellia bacterium]|nr:nitroreductase family protein [Tissierellia bacterium]